MKIHRAANAPDLFIVDGFPDGSECDDLLAKAEQVEAGRPPGIAIKRDLAGISFRMPMTGDDLLVRIAGRIHGVAGFENDLAPSFRFRRSERGNCHPPHLDEYEMEGCIRVATALLYLNDTEEGGETDFPQALPVPVRIRPRRGRLAVWFNYRSDGSAEAAALHASLPVGRGVKATLATFMYKKMGDDGEWRAASPVLNIPPIE